MGAYRLGRLRVKHFRSFDDAENLFRPSGMTLIRGFNHDTGGSSYAGKSSLPVAIALAFGYCPFSVKDQQTWGVKGGLSVSQELIVDDKVWTVTRGSKTSLETPDGKTITGVAAVDAKLRELTGVTPEILSALTYRRQRKPGMFLQKTDAEKKEFLTVVLGLQAFETAAAESAAFGLIASSRQSVLDGKIQQIDAQLRSISDAPPVLVDTSADDAIVHSLELDLTAAQQAMTALDEKMKGIRSVVQMSKMLTQSKYEGDIAVQQAIIVAARRELAMVVADVDTAVREKLRGDLEEARRRLSKLVEAEAQARVEFNARCRSLDSEIATTRAQALDFERINRESEDLQAKLDKARAQRCPTCGQAWHQVESQIQRWEQQKLETLSKMTASFKAGVHVGDLEMERVALAFTPDSKIDRFRAIVESLTKELGAEETKLAEADKVARSSKLAEIAQHERQLAEMKSAMAEEIAKQGAEREEELDRDDMAYRRHRGDVADFQSRIYEAKLKVKATEAENNARVTAYEQRLVQRAELDASLEYAGADRLAAAAEYNAELDFEEMIGYKGFLGVIFDEILAEITEETNAILASVANTAHVTIHFSSEAVSLKGVARKEIRPVITIGGFAANLESGASGGMGSSIELAVDLAVAAVISKRTNSWPGWMILDESFEGMDAVTKETCMEMLSKHAGDRLVLVVDHASETKELFSDFIDIHFRNGRSEIGAKT